MTPLFLKREHFQDLINALKSSGYKVIGPKEKDSTIVYEDLNFAEELPQGVQDEQSPGKYRLKKINNGRWFSWANGPQAIKPNLFSPREFLWRAIRDEKNKLQFKQVQPEITPTAIIGVRACDLAALKLQDQHFIEGEYIDQYYEARRKKLFLIGVNCTHSADTCFCVSTGDGPEASSGYDILLTELDTGFIISSATEQAKNITDQLELVAANNEQLAEARQQIQHAAAQQKRTLPGRNLRGILFSGLDHPQWEDIARRCLACGNCTAVCPTCFCHSEHDEVPLNGNDVTHYRQWSSCFTQEHSYMHGLVIREKTKLQYRQWLTHKLGGWHDQYGRSGCVGCGRCITWCPAGIDITEEARAICGEDFDSDRGDNYSDKDNA